MFSIQRCLVYPCYQIKFGFKSISHLLSLINSITMILSELSVMNVSVSKICKQKKCSELFISPLDFTLGLSLSHLYRPAVSVTKCLSATLILSQKNKQTEYRYKQ